MSSTMLVVALAGPSAAQSMVIAILRYWQHSICCHIGGDELRLLWVWLLPPQAVLFAETMMMITTIDDAVSVMNADDMPPE